MAFLTPMRLFLDVDLNLLTSKLDPPYYVVNEYLQERSNKDNKGKHSILHPNLNHMIDQGASY